MKNKKYLGMLCIVLAGLFVLPVVVSSEGEVYNVDVLVSPNGINSAGDPTDGKVKLAIVVASAPTNTLSGYQEMVYLHKVNVDINKPNKIDEKVTASIIAEEALYNRNVTSIFWVDGRRIYP